MCLAIRTSSGQSSSNYIGADKAKSIALNHAGVSSGNVRSLDVELEKKSSGAYYEVDFESGNTEYSYKIDASSGKVLNVEKEREDD